MRYLSGLLLLLWLASAFAAGGKPVVELHTQQGVITLELDEAKAPKTVENFLRYVREGFYNGTIFHRVIPDYMVQGGGYTAAYEKKATRDPIPNEAGNGLKNTLGTVAMSRGGDPDSANSQFFINTADNASLDHTGQSNRGWGYAVFGKVIKGMDVLEQIQEVETGAAGPFPKNAPVAPVILEKAVIVQDLAGKTPAAAPEQPPAKEVTAPAKPTAKEPAGKPGAKAETKPTAPAKPARPEAKAPVGKPAKPEEAPAEEDGGPEEETAPAKPAAKEPAGKPGKPETKAEAKPAAPAKPEDKTPAGKAADVSGAMPELPDVPAAE